jgi:hypothetical protein
MEVRHLGLPRGGIPKTRAASRLLPGMQVPRQPVPHVGRLDQTQIGAKVTQRWRSVMGGALRTRGGTSRPRAGPIARRREGRRERPGAPYPPYASTPGCPAPDAPLTRASKSNLFERTYLADRHLRQARRWVGDDCGLGCRKCCIDFCLLLSHAHRPAMELAPKS